jgi:hypothetical protein
MNKLATLLIEIRDATSLDSDNDYMICGEFDFASKINEAIHIATNPKLSDGSIDKLIEWSGILALIIEKLRRLALIMENPSSPDVEGRVLAIAESLAELMDMYPNMCNDLDFFKSLYNRRIELLKAVNKED